MNNDDDKKRNPQLQNVNSKWGLIVILFLLLESPCLASSMVCSLVNLLNKQ